MSTKKFSSVGSGQTVPSQSSYLIGSHDIDHLLGRILTHVEALGLKDTQERAIKDLLRQEVWIPFNHPWSVYVPEKLCSVISRAVHSLRETPTNSIESTPVEAEYELSVTTN